MYKELLQKSWDDMMNSDYLFKSNISRFVVEIPLKEIVSNNADKSIILIYYNVYTKRPMILMHQYDSVVDLNKEIIDGYTGEVTEEINFKNERVSQVVYISDDIKNIGM